MGNFPVGAALTRLPTYDILLRLLILLFARSINLSLSHRPLQLTAQGGLHTQYVHVLCVGKRSSSSDRVAARERGLSRLINRPAACGQTCQGHGLDECRAADKHAWLLPKICSCAAHRHVGLLPRQDLVLCLC